MCCKPSSCIELLFFIPHCTNPDMASKLLSLEMGEAGKISQSAIACNNLSLFFVLFLAASCNDFFEYIIYS